MRKGDTVILTWTVPTETTDRRKIRAVGPTRICRNSEKQMTQCGTPVGMAKAQASVEETASEKNGSGKNASKHVSESKVSEKKKVEASYTDTLPAQMESDDAAAVVMYGVEVLNADGRGAGLSNQVQVPAIRTPPPPRDFAARVTSQGIVLTWTNDLFASGSSAANANMSAGKKIDYLYRVYRRQEGSAGWNLVGEVPAGNAPSLTLTDSTFEWEKTYFYRAETVTVIARANKSELPIEGADTPELKVFAADVFPPAVPAELQAVFSGPGQAAFVDLIWAPVSDADLAGYNVYRREEGSAAVKVNADLVKSPAYRDTTVVAGKDYWYSVSAVDLRGNESARSEEAEERVP